MPSKMYSHYACATVCGAIFYQKYCGVTSKNVIDGFGDAESPGELPS